MESLLAYEKQKQQLLHTIETVIEISKELNIKIAEKEQSNYEELCEDQFLITVVGEFNRGKSMFINSLLGTNLLASKIKPTTAMITCISHSEEEEISLHYRDDRPPRKLTIEEFQNMSAPREPDFDDVEEQKQYDEQIKALQEIKLANVSVPNEICRRGVQIVDTPGTNDIDTAREDITLSFVPKSDAVIVVLSATMPVTAEEVKFIKARILSEHISKVFIVLNQIDRIKSDEERKRIIEYAAEKLRPLLPNVKVYPIAAKDALTIKMLAKGEPISNKKQTFFTLEETGLLSFEKSLSEFLQHEKGRVKLARHAKKLSLSIDELMLNNIHVRIAALNSEIEEIDQKIEQLQPQIEQYRQHAMNIIQELHSGLKSEESELFYEFDRELKSLFEKVSDSLHDYSGSLNNQKALQKYLRQQIEQEEEPLKIKLTELKKKVLDRHLQVAYVKLKGEDQKIDSEVLNVFNVQLSDNKNKTLDLNEYNKKYLLILGMALGKLSLGLLSSILAPFLFIFAIPLAILGITSIPLIGGYLRDRKIAKIQKALKKQFNVKINEMRSNLINEWDNILVEVNRIFQNEVNKKIEQVEENLRHIRLTSMKSKEEREETRQQLIQTQKRLEEIGQSLHVYIGEEVVS